LATEAASELHDAGIGERGVALGQNEQIIDGLRAEIERRDAEIARLKAPPGADAMKRATGVIGGDLTELPQRIAREIERAQAEGHASGFEAGEACVVDNVLCILDEEGWLGQSKERIRALKDHTP
jgi:uncharacterized small protein (DUF1192 family)